VFNLFRHCRKDEISFDIVAKTGDIVAKNTMLPVSATMSPVSETLSLVWTGLNVLQRLALSVIKLKQSNSADTVDVRRTVAKGRKIGKVQSLIRGCTGKYPYIETVLNSLKTQCRISRG